MPSYPSRLASRLFSDRRLMLCALAMCALFGCQKKPRSLRQIEAEIRELPALYLTAETGQEVLAPIDEGVFVDEPTGELCFPAYQCKNPDCPGKGQGGRPYLFIHRDVFVEVGDNGVIEYSDVPEGADPVEYIKSKGGFLVPTCPACLKIRNLAQESEEQQRQYMQWVQPYELSDSVRRRQVLEQEYQTRQKELYGGGQKKK